MEEKLVPTYTCAAFMFSKATMGANKSESVDRRERGTDGPKYGKSPKTIRMEEGLSLGWVWAVGTYMKGKGY